MKLITKIFLISALFIIFQTINVSAQVVTGANLLAHGVLKLAGGGNKAKQEKIIEHSTTQEKIAGSDATVLRVKEPDIKSKAKAHIIALQKRLGEYHTQYKNNQPINIPKNDSDLIAIQNTDEDWPTEDYVSELRAYKKYAFQQKQQAPAVPHDSSIATPANAIKKDSTYL